MDNDKTQARPPEYGGANGSDADRLRSDLEFIAGMLHEWIIIQDHHESFHLCEAWEIAKHYRPNK